MIRKKIGIYLALIVTTMLMAVLILPVIQKYDEKYLKVHNQVAWDFKSNMNYGELFNTENNKLQSLYDMTVKNGADNLKKAENQISKAEETINQCKLMVDEDKSLVENQLIQMKESEELLSKIDQKKVHKETLLSLHDSLINLLHTYNQALDQYEEVLSLEQKIYSALKAERDLKEIAVIIDEVNQSSGELSGIIKDLNGYIVSYNELQI
jgi:DNA repair exonuclease SbcCD ATPase subunit